MSNQERFNAVSAYWAREFKLMKKRRNRAPEFVAPIERAGCNCEGAGWYHILLPDGRTELKKCACGIAGQSPAERAFSRELDVLAEKTFDNFDIGRPYQDLPGLAAGAQRQLIQIAFNKAKAFAKEPRGWLYIHGTPGTGKSHLAAAIANYNRAQMSIIYRSMPAMMDIIRENANALESFMRQVASTDLVIIDDIGADNRPTEWAEARIFSVINGRVDKPTVFTSNFDVADLPYGEHIRDRLNAARRCWMSASSMRLAGE